jgi:hypothetical protein
MSRITSDQYRTLAEGLLNKALDVQGERQSDHIRDAIRYLRYARAQDQGEKDSDGSVDLSDQESERDLQQRYCLVRQLLKQALEVPTPKGLEELLQFGTKFRRLSVWNAQMAEAIYRAAVARWPAARIYAAAGTCQRIFRSSTEAARRAQCRETEHEIASPPRVITSTWCLPKPRPIPSSANWAIHRFKRGHMGLKEASTK